MVNEMIKASIIGATGYVGEELLRLLMAHPKVEISGLYSNSSAGSNISSLYKNYISRDFLLKDSGETIDCDVVFLALPHGHAAKFVPGLLARGIKVIDMSADYRYDDPAIYEFWYKVEADRQNRAVYGLSELYSEKIKTANFVANPGCYTTCAILSMYPLAKAGLIEPQNIIVDAKSGVTGAGRGAAPYAETEGNFKAYSVAAHRHTSEIEQEVSRGFGSEVTLNFTPHLLPCKRGILETIYLQPKTSDYDKIKSAFEHFYANSPFVHFVSEMPELKDIVGSNNLHIGAKIDERTGKLIVVSCLDNLIKGAAGQGIQNMNLMFGLDEALGLPKLAWYL